MTATGAQVRMARAALKWGVRELAEKAQVSPNTVTRVEADQPVNAATMAAVQRALEDGGVKFLPRDSFGPGVRLKRPRSLAEEYMLEALAREEGKPDRSEE